MKSLDLSLILKKVAEILSLYGDIPITEAFEKIIIACKNDVLETKTNKSDSKIKADYTTIITDEFIETLHKSNNEELNEIFKSTKELQTKKELFLLADKLSIKVAKSSTIAKLKNHILSYFDRLRMDNTIKNDRI